MSPLTPRRARPRALRNALLAGGAVACSFALTTTAAQAAGSDVQIYISVFPADFAWDGISQPAPLSTGSYSGFYYSNLDGTGNQGSSVQQLRGGAVVSQREATGIDNGGADPVSVVAGDVFRVVRTSDGAILGETTFSGQPTITSSVLGQTLFAGTSAADGASRNVGLFRRIARTRTGTTSTQATYRWTDVTPRPADAPDYDDSAYQGGVYPDRPAEPAADHYWLLQVETPAQDVPYTFQTNAPEVVSEGRFDTITPTAFSGSFTTPIAAGDWVNVAQNTMTVANDVSTTVAFSVIAAAGVVPPPPAPAPAPAPDRLAPKVKALDLGARTTSVASFLKDGLTSFATLDEAGSVRQQLQVFVKPAKKAAAPKKKGGKAKKGTKQVAKRGAKPTLVVIGAGGGSTPVAGGTAKSTVRAVKTAKKTLARTGKSVVAATLVTVVRDGAGNVSTTSTPVKLTDNAVAKKVTAKKAKKGKRGKGAAKKG
jgi:hypothetical protein